MKPVARSSFLRLRTVAALLFSLQLSLPVAAASLDDLLNAAKLGDTGEVAQLIARGMDTNSTEQSCNTLLILAAREEQPKVVAELIKQRGVKLDARNAAGDEAHGSQTLRESEERFRQLAEHIDAVFWLTSPDTSEVLYVSPAFDTIWELPRDLLYVNPTFWIDHIHPEDRKRVATAAACQAHLPYDEEYRIVTPNGQVRWIRDRSFAVKNAQGETYRIAGIAVDITAAKQMEVQIRASELRHRALVELSTHAIFVNCDDRIVFANQACTKLLGAIAPSQLFGKTVLEIMLPYR